MTEQQAIKVAQARADRNSIQYRVFRHRDDKEDWIVCKADQEPEDYVWIYTIGRNWKAWH